MNVPVRRLCANLATAFGRANMITLTDAENTRSITIPISIAERVGVWKDMLATAKEGSGEAVKVRNNEGRLTV